MGVKHSCDARPWRKGRQQGALALGIRQGQGSDRSGRPHLQDGKRHSLTSGAIREKGSANACNAEEKNVVLTGTTKARLERASSAGRAETMIGFAPVRPASLCLTCFAR